MTVASPNRKRLFLPERQVAKVQPSTADNSGSRASSVELKVEQRIKGKMDTEKISSFAGLAAAPLAAMVEQLEQNCATQQEMFKQGLAAACEASHQATSNEARVQQLLAALDESKRRVPRDGVDPPPPSPSNVQLTLPAEAASRAHQHMKDFWGILAASVDAPVLRLLQEIHMAWKAALVQAVQESAAEASKQGGPSATLQQGGPSATLQQGGPSQGGSASGSTSNQPQQQGQLTASHGVSGSHRDTSLQLSPQFRSPGDSRRQAANMANAPKGLVQSRVCDFERAVSQGRDGCNGVDVRGRVSHFERTLSQGSAASSRTPSRRKRSLSGPRTEQAAGALGHTPSRTPNGNRTRPISDRDSGRLVAPLPTSNVQWQPRFRQHAPSPPPASSLTSRDGFVEGGPSVTTARYRSLSVRERIRELHSSGLQV